MIAGESREGRAESSRSFASGLQLPTFLLLDPPASGAWNMAVDEVLWRWSAAAGRCCWRFYRWEEPTLSLGYFQSYDDRARHAASQGCPVVRRPSGGGAIVHDKEKGYLGYDVGGGEPLFRLG